MKIGFDDIPATSAGTYSQHLARLLAEYAPEHEYIVDGKRYKELDLYHGFRPGLPLPVLLRRIPCVVTVHNLNFLRYPHLYSLPERLVLLRLYRQALRSASRLITVNRDAREELSERLHIDPRRIEVVMPLAARVPQEPPADADLEAVRRKYMLPREFVLMLGTVEPRHNHETLFEAFFSLGERARETVRTAAAGRRGGSAPAPEDADWGKDASGPGTQTVSREGALAGFGTEDAFLHESASGAADWNENPAAANAAPGSRAATAIGIGERDGDMPAGRDGIPLRGACGAGSLNSAAPAGGNAVTHGHTQAPAAGLSGLDRVGIVVCGRRTTYSDFLLGYARSRHLGARVDFIYELTPDDLPALFRLARAFVYLPDAGIEASIVPVVEALRAGLPMILSDTQCNREAAGDAAVYVRPEAEGEVAAALENVLLDKNFRREMQSRERRRAELFSEYAVARRLIDIYSSL